MLAALMHRDAKPVSSFEIALVWASSIQNAFVTCTLKQFGHLKYSPWYLRTGAVEKYSTAEKQNLQRFFPMSLLYKDISCF
jgi:hypothetical protein